MPRTDTTAVQPSAPDQRGGPAPQAAGSAPLPAGFAPTLPPALPPGAARRQAALHALACRVTGLVGDAHLVHRIAECVEAPHATLPDDGEDYAEALRNCAALALQLSTFLNLYVVEALAGHVHGAPWTRENLPRSIFDHELCGHLDVLEGQQQGQEALQ